MRLTEEERRLTVLSHVGWGVSLSGGLRAGRPKLAQHGGSVIVAPYIAYNDSGDVVRSRVYTVTVQ